MTDRPAPADLRASAPAQRSVRLDLQRAKGLAITLVVFGHVVARDVPPGAEWYAWAKAFVYSFHMPLFMWTSGFVFAMWWNPARPLGAQHAESWRRVRRILPAFFVMGLVILLGKWVAGHFVRVDNPVHDMAQIGNLLLRPTKSYASSLWYIYVLSGLLLAIPPLLALLGQRLLLALVLTAGLWMLPESDLLAWQRFRELTVYFVLGIVWHRYSDVLDQWTDRLWPIMLPLLVAAFLWSGGHKMLCGALAVVGLLGLMRSRWLKGDSALLTLGDYTFPIYLFNTIFIGLTKAGLAPILPWNGKAFLVQFPILFAAGLLLPLILKRYVLSHWPLVDRYT